MLCRREVAVSANVGVMVHRPAVGAADAIDFLQRAGDQMYAANRDGKNIERVARRLKVDG